ncbi:MAG: hypothetical protein HOO06_05165 [Bdellovibrionaceae bacterium]|jgi:hypothetical protein|nr:hypothetical protein [Pseudobdellovibrionaceae bacterium]
MKKRRKFSEIYEDMDSINKRKPTIEELNELEETLKKSELIISESENETDSDGVPQVDKSAMNRNKIEDINGNEPNRI